MKQIDDLDNKSKVLKAVALVIAFITSYMFFFKILFL